MKLRPSETELAGEWVFKDGHVRSDETCDRIEWLTTKHLKRIAMRNWETLFKDPDDGRYWERTYPQGETPGGGPPRLSTLSLEQAHAKYQFS
jgi:hypothetical protein